MHFGHVAGEPAQNGGVPVDRAVIGNVDLVAKIGDVPHRGLDEDVLVTNERDPDNACALKRVACLERGPKAIGSRAQCESRIGSLRRSRRTTSSVRSQEIASNGPPPSSRLIPDVIKKIAIWFQHARMLGDHLIKVKGMIDAIRIEKVEGVVGIVSFIMSPRLTSGLLAPGFRSIP